jgi:cytochrome c peroxidase
MFMLTNDVTGGRARLPLVTLAMRILFLWVPVVSGLVSCKDADTSPAENPYAFKQPDNFPEAVYTFGNNAVTQDGFELGRALFYDPMLSLDNSIACANCHQQAVAFADPVHRFSRGVGDRAGVRNAPPIQNMAFQRDFFWDGGVKHLDFVPINAITSEIEMGESLAHVVEKLQRDEKYRERFNRAFGTPEITSQQLLYALSQFMNLMVSANSRYDKHIRNEGEQLTAVEKQGLALFGNKCSSCHSTDLFTDGSFRNNGLDETFGKDSGRAHITEFSGDRGKFKVPALRNVEVTPPYMHDGRFTTLEEVLDHYAHGVQYSETLDPLLRAEELPGISITKDEKYKLIEFLKTLTDREFLTDSRFSRPAQ